jgi:hypothetical protein
VLLQEVQDDMEPGRTSEYSVKIDLTVFITPWGENNVLLPPG